MAKKQEKNPKILETEEKEIKEKKPPNDKIIYFTIGEKNVKT